MRLKELCPGALVSVLSPWRAGGRAFARHRHEHGGGDYFPAPQKGTGQYAAGEQEAFVHPKGSGQLELRLCQVKFC